MILLKDVSGLTHLQWEVQETKFHDVSEVLRRNRTVASEHPLMLPVLQDEALFTNRFFQHHLMILLDEILDLCFAGPVEIDEGCPRSHPEVFSERLPQTFLKVTKADL